MPLTGFEPATYCLLSLHTSQNPFFLGVLQRGYPPACNG